MRRDDTDKGKDSLANEVREEVEAWKQDECWKGDSIEDAKDDHGAKDG